VSFLIAFAATPMYGTALMLLLAYIVLQLPFAARSAHAAASSLGYELGEASRVFGASEGRTFRKVLLPVALPGLVAGWVIVFIHNVGEITASALLSGTGNPVIGRVILNLWNSGEFPQLTALAIVMSAINSAIVVAMLRFTRRQFTAATT
jgi:iron(III) transport system permease protein